MLKSPLPTRDDIDPVAPTPGAAAATPGARFAARPDIPLYYQIKEDVFLHLRSGQWPPGFELPPEHALCAHYGVSRGTLRRAIGDLVSEGFVERRRGRGTFVCQPKLESGVEGSYRRFRMIGPPLDPGARVLACERVAALPDIAGVLGLAPDAPIWQLERVRHTRGEPVAIQTSYLPAALCPDLDHQALQHRHLVDVLRDVYGVRLGRAVEYIDPGVADRHIVRHLGVTPTTPVFRIERSTYTIDNRLAEYRRASLRGDLYRYRIELR